MVKNKQNKFLVCIGITNIENSFAALKYAALKAKASGAVVEILSVIDTTGQDYGLFSVDKVMKQEKRSKSEEVLKDVSKKVQEWSGQTPILNIKEGIISDKISEVLSEDKTINLIIVGTARNSTSKGKLISYLTEQISSKLFLPLIIIPHDLSDTELKKII